MNTTVKDKLLKYISGNLASETGNNVPYGIPANSYIEATLWGNLFATLGSYVLKKVITNSTNTILVAYGSYDSNTKGFIALSTLDFQTISIITQNSLGTNLGTIEYLNFDENGMFFGVDYLIGTGGRFLLLNNFTIPNSSGVYEVALRKSYISPSAVGDFDLVHCTWLKGSSITKKNGESKYVMLSTNTTEGSYGILLTELNIVVGEPVEWTYNSLITTPFNFGTTMFQDSYCEFGEDTYTVKFNALFNSSGTITYREYTSVDGAAVTTWISSTTITGPKTAIIINLTQAYFCFNDGTYFDIYSSLNEIDTRIYHRAMNVGDTSSYFILTKQIGEVFFYYYSGDGFGSNESVYGHIINNVGINIYIYPFYIAWSGNDILIISKQYNLYNYYVYLSSQNFVSNIQEIYNPLNYNGQPYENEDSLLPNSAVLKNSVNDLLFARNLYNLSLSNNVSVATVEVPNNYLNEDTISKEDLISKTNIEFVNGLTTINKNIYETLLINFISTLYMKDNNIPATPKFNLNGASKVTKGINTSNEYANTQIGKLRVTYADLTNATFDITDITIVGTVATINVDFYVTKIVTKIEILSTDLTTVYLTKDIVESNVNKSLTGTTITITDTQNDTGKITSFECASTQAGIPTPTAPIPILSTGDTGILNVTSSNGTVTNNYPITLPVGYVGGSLPNGVKDDDELGRLGELVLNGSENWVLAYAGFTNTIRFNLVLSTIRGLDTTVNCLCDKFPKDSFSNRGLDIESASTCIFSSVGRIDLKILKSRLTTQDVAGFKTWLASNNVTVYYELATPVDVSSSIALPTITTYEDYTQVTNTNTVKANLTMEYTSTDKATMEINKTYNIKQDIQVI